MKIMKLFIISEKLTGNFFHLILYQSFDNLK